MYKDSSYSFFFYFYTALDNRIKSYIKKKNKNKSIVIEDSFIYEKNVEGSFNILKEDLFIYLTDEEKAYLFSNFYKKQTIKQIALKYNVKEMRVYYVLNSAKNKVKKRAEELDYI